MRKPFLILALIALLPLSSAAQVVAIKVGRLIDVEAGTSFPNQIILIEGKVVKEVGPKVAIPCGVEVIDLSNATVLPGLMDAHTHLCDLHGNTREGMLSGQADLLNFSVRTPTALRALIGAKNAREMLLSGFTTVRDMGNSGLYACTALRQAIEQGFVPGPTVINAGRIISPFGGQFGSLPPERPDLGEPEYLYADTRDEMTKAVRQNVLYGAKVIKIVVDDQPYQYTVDDIRYIIAEAANAGLKVAAHVHTQRGMHAAVEAGVASIEHAFRATDDQLKLAKEKGVFLVGTDLTPEILPMAGAPDSLVQFYYKQVIVDRLARAYRIGTPIAFGTDVFFPLGGKTRGEIALTYLQSFKDAGIPPADILRMMTINAARLLGVENERGALKPGMKADIIAVNGDPLKNILELQRVKFVMKDGRVIKHEK